MAQQGEIESVWRQVTGAGYDQKPPGWVYSGGQNLSVGQLADFIKGGGGGGGISGINYQSPDFSAIVQQAQQMYKQANEPAIQSLQASIPEISGKYTTERQRLEAEKEPLTQRYQNLLSEVTGRQQQEEKRTGIATARELGRRGIIGGGLYEQTVNEALSPITQFYTGQAKEIGLAGEESLRNLEGLMASLTPQETAELRAIQNAIAQLQAGGGQQGIQTGLGLFQSQQQQNQFLAQLALQQQIAEQEAAARQASQAFSERQYQETTLPYTQAQIQNIISEIANRGKTTTAKPNELKFQTITDVLGNQTLLVLDPYTGKEVTRMNVQQPSVQTESQPTGWLESLRQKFNLW